MGTSRKLRDASINTVRMSRVFLSLRFAEALPQAVAVKTALEQRSISVFLCDIPPGKDIALEVTDNLVACDLVVIFGTETYGFKTKSSFSTYQELRYVMDNDKPYFYIKMCDSFSVSYTAVQLPDSVSYFAWMPSSLGTISTTPPSGLVDKIASRLSELRKSDGRDGPVASHPPVSAPLRDQALTQKLSQLTIGKGEHGLGQGTVL